MDTSKIEKMLADAKEAFAKQKAAEEKARLELAANINDSKLQNMKVMEALLAMTAVGTGGKSEAFENAIRARKKLQGSLESLSAMIADGASTEDITHKFLEQGKIMRECWETYETFTKEKGLELVKEDFMKGLREPLKISPSPFRFS